MRRFHLLYVVPTVVLLAIATAPLWRGTGTLHLRDVLTSHYPLKAAQAELLSRGELPLIDPYRAGGQPLLGNPNALPLYPTNLLFLVWPPLRALNAHFWIHLLLAPFAFAWLGRAWGLGRPAAWAGGVFYGASGFFFSLLNLYNLVAGAALAPAFVAACLDARAGRPRRWAAAGGLWGLLLLGGDPFFALLALAAAASAVAVRERPLLPWRRSRAAAALAAGSALAAPMLVEFLRILPLSLRGYRGYSAESALLQSFDPRTAVELFLPLFFGTPDLAFWGQRFYDGLPPLLYSLSPGILVLALLTLVPQGRAALWAGSLAGAGIFLALGKWNPLVRLLYELPGGSALRYPIKTWLLVALGTALLAALGFERLLTSGRRRLGIVLALVAAAYAAFWVLSSFTGLAGPDLAFQQVRWSGLALLSLALILLLGGALAVLRRRPRVGGALILAVHLGGQLFFLRPLYRADEATFYTAPPELLELVPDGTRIVHGGLGDLFGASRVALDELPFPSTSTHWLTRGHFAQLYPSAGVPHGRRYELNPSPEGLDAFVTFALKDALSRLLDDAERVRVLRASGVEVLLLDRPLAAAALPEVELLARRRLALHDLFVYRLREPLGAAVLATHVVRAPDMGSALRSLTAPTFDPRSTVVLPGDTAAPPQPEATAAGGTARLVAETADALELDVDAGAAGVLVVQRTWHAIYRATVDGEPAPVLTANLHRIGVAVPAGRHRVRVWADRRPTRLAGLAALLGLAGLVWLSAWRGDGWRSGRQDQGTVRRGEAPR